MAFWSDNALRKVPITGGTAVTLAETGNPLGMSWTGDRILLGQLSPRGVIEVPANGGAAKMLVALDEKKSEFAQSPSLVRGGQAVLFTLRTGSGSWDSSSIVVDDLSSKTRTVLVDGGTDGQLLPTGHLVYVRQATVFAMPFDRVSSHRQRRCGAGAAGRAAGANAGERSGPLDLVGRRHRGVHSW